MKEIIKPGLVLFLVTFVAAVCLGGVYDLTKDAILAQEASETDNAMQLVLPLAGSFLEDIPIPEGSAVTGGYTGYKDKEPVGYVFSVEPIGYGGAIKLMVGLDLGGVVQGIKIVTHSETAGLGANADSEAFYSQFQGKSGLLQVTKNDPGENEIEAITSATITTNAVIAGVNECIGFYGTYLKGGGN